MSGIWINRDIECRVFGKEGKIKKGVVNVFFFFLLEREVNS